MTAPAARKRRVRTWNLCWVSGWDGWQVVEGDLSRLVAHRHCKPSEHVRVREILPPRPSKRKK